ncbi:MAG TPA: glycosyltransferase family 39 protein [Solirubrobacteraceae bacterium]|nr:glycosyltransferase family 39 protein [Solirubrobacteraceae bacterium]
MLALAPALAAALSLYEITARSLSFDEGATVAIVSQHGRALLDAIAHDGGNMSGWYLLLHVLTGAFGDGLAVLRLPSAIAAVAAVALIGAIADRLFGRRAAVGAGLLAAVSLPLVYWAQTARGYAGMVAFSCAAMLAFVRMVDPRAGERPGRGSWLAYVAALTAAMYCSFVAVLVLAAQLPALARRRDARRRVAWALVVTAVLCAPLAVLAVHRGSGQLFWVPRPDSEVETQVLQSLTSAGLSPVFHHHPGTYVLMWATVAAVAAAAVHELARARRGHGSWGAGLALAWAVVPPALTFGWSFVGQPIFVPRNLLACTPALALVLAPPLMGIGEAARSAAGRGRWRSSATARRAVAIAGPALVAILIAARSLPLAASYGVSPEPWNAVTRSVLAAARPGDCIAFYPQDARMAFAYYAGSDPRAPRSILPPVRWGVVRPYVESYETLSAAALARAAAGCRRMWFVTSHEGQANGPPASRAHRARWYALRAELERRFGYAPVRVFGYASRIHVQLMGGAA